jgi:hypothetical protein
MILFNLFQYNKENMHRYLKIFFALCATVLVLACSLAGAPSVQTDNVSTIVAATLQSLASATSAAAQATSTAAPPSTAVPQGVQVSYYNVSFLVPKELASGASSQTVPASDEQNGGPWGVAPQHMEFKLNDYNLPSGSFSEILIDVYPAQDYANVYEGAKISLQRLQALLASPSTPLTNENLPQVPFFNAASMFAAQAKFIQFKDGSGVRMITQYGQAVGPVTNSGTFYHFEGLTSDGKYYIVAVLPIQAAFLANGNDPSAQVPADGIPFPGYNYTDASYYENYFKAVTDKMNATPDESFAPSLGTLDSLIKSLLVSP